MLEACANLTDLNMPWGNHVGVDLAATGDKSVAVLVCGSVVRDIHSWRAPANDEAPLLRSVDEIQALIPKWRTLYGDIPWRNVHCDVGGLGRGVCERLGQLGARVDSVDFGSAPENGWTAEVGEYHVFNKRAEQYWVLRRLLSERKLCVPREFKQAWKELTWAKWGIQDRAGESCVILESKREIRSRHSASPDTADALALALCRSAGPVAFRWLNRDGTLAPVHGADETPGQDFSRAPAWTPTKRDSGPFG